MTRFIFNRYFSSFFLVAMLFLACTVKAQDTTVIIRYDHDHDRGRDRDHDRGERGGGHQSGRPHNAIYSVGLGGTQGIGIWRDRVNEITYHGITYPGLSLNVSGEYRLRKQRIVGLGWETGMNFYFSPYRYVVYAPGGVFVSSQAAMEIPLIFKVNVHILEATKVRIKDKLDLYAGLSFGGGPAFFLSNEPPPPDYYPGGSGRVYGIIHVGPQVGVRYWFNQKVGIFGEFGWGATFANIGVSF